MNTKNRMEIMQNSYIIKKPNLESKPSVYEFQNILNIKTIKNYLG